jgi:hypothetical protein
MILPNEFGSPLEVGAYPVFHGVDPAAGFCVSGGPAAVFSGEQAGGVVVGITAREGELVADEFFGPPGGGGDDDDV